MVVSDIESGGSHLAKLFDENANHQQQHQLQHHHLRHNHIQQNHHHHNTHRHHNDEHHQAKAHHHVDAANHNDVEIGHTQPNMVNFCQKQTNHI